MESRIAKAVGLKYTPVAVVLANDKPEKALQFKKGKWGCVMFMFANAARGRPRPSTRRPMAAGAAGSGWGSVTPIFNFRGAWTASPTFSPPATASGKPDRQVGQALEGTAGKEFAENFLEGEGYVQTPELV